MNPDNLKTLADQLTASGLLPEMPLVDDSEARQPHVHAALVVNLSEVADVARARHATSLDVYADTLVIPPHAVVGITGELLRMTIVARQVVAGAHSRIVVNHAEHKDEDHHALRMICADIQGDVAIYSDRPGDNALYDLSVLRQTHDVPTFITMGWRDGKRVSRPTPVPVGLLAKGQPLHALLAASFQFCAGAIATMDGDRERLALVHEVLGWIKGWAGLQDDVAQLARLADRLKAVLPAYVDDQLVIPVPGKPARAYLELAKSRMELAKAIELDGKFLDQAGSFRDVARDFAQANIQRDSHDIAMVCREIEELQERHEVLNASLEHAVRMVEEQRFDAEIKKIELDGQIALDRVDKIVKASFDLAIGVISLGVSIAAICVGVPPDPTALVAKERKGVEGLFEAVKKTQNLGSHLQNLKALYALPFTFLWKSDSRMKKNFVDLAKAGLQIKAAAGTLLGGSGGLKDTAAIEETLNASLRVLAQQPGPLEAKAAWDALEAEAINQLDKVINDSNTAGNIKSAATAYKTAVQKMAIQGRLMAEHKASIQANNREIAARALQRCSQIRKQQELESLQDRIADRQSLDAHIRREIRLRFESASRSFFAASFGFRRAQYYESYMIANSTPMIVDQAARMANIYNTMVTDHSDATNQLDRRRISFDRPILRQDRQLLEELVAGRPVILSIDPREMALDSYSGIRVSDMQVWLDHDEPVDARIVIELVSGTSFRDPGHDGGHVFSGSPVRIPFEYQGDKVMLHKSLTGVQPTPFTDWMVKLTPHENITLPQSLRIELRGSALQ